MRHHSHTKQEDTQPISRTSWTFDPNDTAKYMLAAIALLAMCFLSAGLSLFFAADYFIYVLFQVCAILACFAAILALVCGVYVWVSDRERPKLWYKEKN